MAGDVTSTARVLVLKPRAPNFFVLLVDDELIVAQIESEGANHVDSTRPGSDPDDPDGLAPSKWRLLNLIVAGCRVRRCSFHTFFVTVI